MTTLDIYLEAVRDPVGKLTSAPDGNISFQYTVKALPHPISVSLPLQEQPYGGRGEPWLFLQLAI